MSHILEELPAARRILFGPRRQMQQRLLAIGQNAPGRQHRLARLAQMPPLGDLDKQIDDREFRQIAAGKRLGDLAHCRTAQPTAALAVSKQRLDIARRQPARVHLHFQSLQLIGAAPHHLSDARAERLLPIRHLRRAVLDGALRAVHATPSIAIAISGAGAGAAGVVIAPHRVPRFAFQRLLGLHRIRTRDLLIKGLRNSQISPMRLYSGERGELIVRRATVSLPVF